ncbi:hypothetical protein A6A06_04130 [Streptomyces sp. CB02923]|uniref:hypothetical protein n=1 Tax=Streptomyces sp. CB02923 TaxID=1718985 RepID=UPI00093EDE72|nr:hypothetical protein [Streptomyces sp. CB02923]OKI09831.1 hypothetical protein A6A06_04130 [Streptomyces sp. CB02923]
MTAQSARRTLRAAVASAALGAAVLAPVSGAFAATPGAPGAAAPAASSAAARPAADGTGRYEGQPVAIGNGMVAVLRNVPSAGGPEAWIRYVGPQWKPGDWYLVRVLGLLDREHPTAHLKGLSLRLTGVSGTSPKLRVSGGTGGAKSYALPKAAAPATGGKVTGTGGRHQAGQTAAHRPGNGTASGSRKSCTVTRRVAIGGGTLAVLTRGPQGPGASFEDGPGNAVPGTSLDRTHPSLARFGAKIIDPYGARPKLRFTMQGASYPPGTANFPALPRGCAPAAQPGKGGAADGPHGAKAAGSRTTGGVGAQAAPTGSQTKVLPKGAVAAGYDVADVAEEPDTTPLFTAGGAFAAAGAAGVVFAVRRRRQSEGAGC